MKLTRSEILLLLVLAAIQFTHIVDFMILMPLGPQLMRVLDIEPQQFSLLVSCYTLAAGLSGLAASFYIDLFDRKKVLFMFLVGFCIGTFACSFANDYLFLLIARSLTGVFGGVLTSIVMSIVSDAFEYSRRGTAIGIIMSAFAVASILGVPFGLYLANLSAWETPFFVLGFVVIFLLLLCYFFIPNQDAHTKKVNNDPLKVLRMIFHESNQQIALLLIFFLVLGQFSIIPFISPSFVANAGLKESELPLMYLFGGICSMFAAPTMGRLSDKYGKHKIFRIFIIISLVPIYLITNLDISPLWKILFISCSFFIVMSGRLIPSMALITSTAPMENRAGFLSIVSSTQQLSAAAASWMAGLIIFTGPNGTLVNYNIVGYIAIASSLFTFFAVTKVKSTYEH